MENKYKWDLSLIFKSEKEYNSAIKEVNTLVDELVTFKGKILKSSSNLLKVLELDRKINILLEKVYVYSFLGYYADLGNVKFQEYKERALSIESDASSKTSFITPELLSSDYDVVLKYISENKELEKYRILLERIFKYKDHVLSDKEEKLISDLSEVIRVPKGTYEELCNNDASFGTIKDEEGKRVKLTSANYGEFLSSKNRNVRKNAFNNKTKFYSDHINTISSLYIGKIKSNCAFSKIRNYKSVLEMALFDDDVSTALYETLIKITDKNIKYLKDFYELKKKQLGYKLHMYDLYVNTSKKPETKVTYEEAIDIVNNALKPLGKDYLKVFNELLNTRHVDVYPQDKKRNGAFKWGVYRIPYVLLNFNGTIDSVSTLAHEMGHAMNMYYGGQNQDFLYASEPVFTAEIASLVNEILLCEYLYNNSKTKDEKEYYLIEFLDKFKGAVYRQTMFAEFESIIHKKCEEGCSLTKDMLCDIYYELNKKHFDGPVVVDEDIKYEWARVPHFYTSFYVYKYATGFISALLIADKLLNTNDFKDKYIKFLSSGETMLPLDLLKSIDIDLTNEETLEKAFSIFNSKLKELKTLEGCE